MQTWWNTKQAPVYGFQVALYKGSLKKCCDLGAKLFDGTYFSKPPGPFKRASAYVVMGRLNPFFKFVPLHQGDTENCPSNDRDRHAWLARMMALAIPAILSSTQVQLGEEWTLLRQWNGFPSKHYKLEFLAWLRWLDGFEQYRTMFANEWEALSEKRAARMVMATSLMIESCYYGSQVNLESDICGKVSACFEHLEEEHELDLLYDVYYPQIPPEFPPDQAGKNGGQ